MTVLAYSPVLPSVEVFGAYEGIASATAVNQTVSLTFTPTEGTLFVVPYEIDTISQLQLEVGPTPSSYIPTPSSGGTATRGAETLTVAAANLPWPTPKVIGPELVTNGTFDTDVSGWIPVADTGQIVTWQSGGYARFDRNSGNSTFQSTASVPEAGKVYLVSVDVLDNTFTGTLTIAIGGASFLVGTNVSAGTYSRAIVTTSTAPLTVVLGAAVVGYYDLDNISVREIDPLSVSIQMDGRMTYADEGASTQETFLRWQLDGNNNIHHWLNTSLGTGTARFWQNSSSVSDQVLSGNDTYAPGVLVPYNIASRHGSTFINGAVDGVEIGEDVTPVALPNLSATDLNLAFDYMGTIRTFRMWNKDLTDTGIEEAST